MIASATTGPGMTLSLSRVVRPPPDPATKWERAIGAGRDDLAVRRDRDGVEWRRQGQDRRRLALAERPQAQRAAS